MRVAATRSFGTDTVLLGVGLLLVAVAVGQFLGSVYGGATAAGIGAMLSFSFATLLN